MKSHGPGMDYAADETGLHGRDFTLMDFNRLPIPFKFTLSRDAVLPRKIGIRKDLYAIGDLIRFRAKADVVVNSGKIIYGVSSKDTIFNGRFSVNIPGRLLAYQRHLNLPNGGTLLVMGGLHCFDSMQPTSLLSRIKPVYGIQLRLGSIGSKGNVVYSGDGFSLKHRMHVSIGLAGLKYPRCEVETFTYVRIPQISSRYSVQKDGIALGGLTVGGGAEGGLMGDGGRGLEAHIQAYNLVFRL